MRMMRRWMTWMAVSFVCMQTAIASDAWLFRIVGPDSTIVTAMNPDGTVTWSNGTVNVTCRVDVATGLVSVAPWSRYTEVVVTSVVTRLRFIDPAPPPDMAFIPAGTFAMGDSLGDNIDDAREVPVHSVYVSAFYLDEYEITKAKWDETRSWALTNGYVIPVSGSSKASNHPVHGVSWYDALKWCNARSQQGGLSPCYTNADGTVYRTGPFDGGCNWIASGYRLPTETEWEKAARGGQLERRFPWSDADTIGHSRANYNGLPGVYLYDQAPEGHHPVYAVGDTPYTSPVGSFPKNGYGLYDMAGNVFEWCWDWYDASWYTHGSSTDPDTRGPSSSPINCRVWRGGSWNLYSFNAASARRTAAPPDFTRDDIGFRCARRP